MKVNNVQTDVGSISSLEIVLQGNKSDVDLIIMVSDLTLLRFISKTTGDCIIMPFAVCRWTICGKKGRRRLCKATDALMQIIGLQHRVARDLSSCVIRHYPCSRWFQDVGKCSKQNEVDTKLGEGGGGHESSLLLQFILYIVFIVYVMFIMGNRTIYIYIIAEEGLKEKVGVIKPKWK